MIIDYVFMNTLPILKKRALKIRAPTFMKYCNLKFGYNKASVKSTALQNCTGKKNTPWQTKPHEKMNGL